MVMRVGTALIFVFFWLFSISVLAQEIRKMGEFGNITCDDWMGRLHPFAAEIGNPESESFGYVVVYEGMYATYDFAKNDERVTKYFLSREGAANVRAEEIRNYLTMHRGVPPEKYMILSGGFRREYTVEFWVGTRKSGVPPLNPDLD